MKELVHIVNYTDHDQESDAMGNPYEGDPYFVSFCWQRGYVGPQTWPYFVMIDEVDKATCPECLDAFGMQTLAELP